MDEAVQRYFASVPQDRRPMVDRLHELIVDLYPEARIAMGYGMPTYRVGEGWIALASQKHHVSLYTCSHEHIASFKQRHPEMDTGKGCIRFRRGDALPARDLEAVIRHAFTHPKGR